MATRGPRVVTSRYCETGFCGALPVILTLNCLSPMRSPYETARRGSPSTVTMPSLTLRRSACALNRTAASRKSAWRSEEHTSELQSRQYLVCRLLLEKKKKKKRIRQELNTTS